jgi:hypothetical protein
MISFMKNIQFHTDEQLAESQAYRTSEFLIKTGALAFYGTAISGIAEALSRTDVIPDSLQTVGAGGGLASVITALSISAARERWSGTN